MQASARRSSSTACSATAAVRTGPALLVWLRTVNGVGCLSAIANGVVVPRATLQTWLRAVAQHLQEMSADDR